MKSYGVSITDLRPETNSNKTHHRRSSAPGTGALSRPPRTNGYIWLMIGHGVSRRAISCWNNFDGPASAALRHQPWHLNIDVVIAACGRSADGSLGEIVVSKVVPYRSRTLDHNGIRESMGMISSGPCVTVMASFAGGVAEVEMWMQEEEKRGSAVVSSRRAKKWKWDGRDFLHSITETGDRGGTTAGAS